MENTKICSKCGKELPLEYFYKDRTKKDGLQPYCKGCNNKRFKEWYAEHRDEQIEKKKQWYSTLEGYARSIRWTNLREDRMYGRIAADEDPLPSIEQYIELLQKPDYYDGEQYHWSEMGVDRIDNSKPHTLDNIVPCTTEHNRQRGRKSFEEFKEYFKQFN